MKPQSILGVLLLDQARVAHELKDLIGLTMAAEVVVEHAWREEDHGALVARELRVHATSIDLVMHLIVADGVGVLFAFERGLGHVAHEVLVTIAEGDGAAFAYVVDGLDELLHVIQGTAGRVDEEGERDGQGFVVLEELAHPGQVHGEAVDAVDSDDDLVLVTPGLLQVCRGFVYQGVKFALLILVYVAVAVTAVQVDWDVLGFGSAGVGIGALMAW